MLRPCGKKVSDGATFSGLKASEGASWCGVNPELTIGNSLETRTEMTHINGCQYTRTSDVSTPDVRMSTPSQPDFTVSHFP